MTISFSIKSFLLDERGQDLVEYALLLVFVALSVVVATKSLANSVGTVFAAVGNTLTNSV